MSYSNSDTSPTSKALQRSQNPDFGGQKKLRVKVKVASKFCWLGGWWEIFGMVTNDFSASALIKVGLRYKI